MPIKVLPDGSFEEEQGAQSLNSLDVNELLGHSLDMNPSLGTSSSVCGLSLWTYYFTFLCL